jgi:hypothetical protein
MINLDFNTRYTTVLKERVTGRMVAIVDFSGDEGEIRYCEHCFKYGFKNKLGSKILKPGEHKAARLRRLASMPYLRKYLSCL